MITKEKILTDLINYSSYENPLSLSYFRDKYSHNNTDSKQFDNLFKIMVHDLQCDQIDDELLSKPFYLIFENDEGYFIPQNRDEALLGNQFHLFKVKSLLTITSNYSRMIQKVFPVKDPAQMDLI